MYSWIKKSWSSTPCSALHIVSPYLKSKYLPFLAISLWYGSEICIQHLVISQVRFTMSRNKNKTKQPHYGPWPLDNSNHKASLWDLTFCCNTCLSLICWMTKYMRDATNKLITSLKRIKVFSISSPKLFKSFCGFPHMLV